MKKLSKKILVLVLVLCFALMPCVALAADDVNVTVDGKDVVWTDAKPFVDKNGRTLVPLRAVADALGVGVEWSQEDNMAIFSADHQFNDGPYRRYIGFEVNSFYSVDWRSPLDESGNPIYTLNYAFSMMDTQAVEKDGRVYAPARYLAYFFGYDVDWDGATSTVVITKK